MTSTYPSYLPPRPASSSSVYPTITVPSRSRSLSSRSSLGERGRVVAGAGRQGVVESTRGARSVHACHAPCDCDHAPRYPQPGAPGPATSSSSSHSETPFSPRPHSRSERETITEQQVDAFPCTSLLFQPSLPISHLASSPSLTITTPNDNHHYQHYHHPFRLCPPSRRESASASSIPSPSLAPIPFVPARSNGSATFSSPSPRLGSRRHRSPIGLDLSPTGRPSRQLPNATPSLPSPSSPVTPERSNYFATLYPAEYPGYKSPPRFHRPLPLVTTDERRPHPRSRSGSSSDSSFPPPPNPHPESDVEELLDESASPTLSLSPLPYSRQTHSRTLSMSSASSSQHKRKVVIMGAPSVGE